MLQSLLPQHNWQEWQFQQVPKGFWGSIRNQKKVLEWLSSELEIQHCEDWYSVSPDQIRAKGGARLLALYNDSIPRMLQALSSNYHWLPWRFSHVPVGFWDQKKNQEKFLTWLAQQLCIKEWEQWYGVTVDQIGAKGGARFLTLYEGSLCQMLQTLLPQHTWIPWKFRQTPRGFMDSKENQKVALEWLSRELNIGEWEDWYHVTNEQVLEKGGGSLLRAHNSSLYNMLHSLLPHLPLLPWKFHSVPQGFWDKGSNLQKYFLWLVAEHKLGGAEVLATKPLTFFQRNFGDSFAGSQTQLYNALELAFPGR